LNDENRFQNREELCKMCFGTNGPEV